MQQQDQATAPPLQTRRARREAALAALESSSHRTTDLPDSSVPGAVRTPAPHAASSRPDGTVPPAVHVRHAGIVSPARANTQPRMPGPAPYAALGRPVPDATAPHAVSPSVVADPASLARLAAFSEIAELRRASESRLRGVAPAAHGSAARAASADVHVEEAARPAVPTPVVVPTIEPRALATVVAPASPVPALPDVDPAVTEPAVAAAQVAPIATAHAPLSRRATVEARRAAAGKKRRAAGSAFVRPAGRAHKGGWIARAGVLAALGITTIAVPLANAEGDGTSAMTVPLVAEGRSTLEVIASSSTSAAVTDAAIVAEGGTLAGRDAAVASRGSARDTLAGCDLSTSVRSANGRLSNDELCDLSQSGHKLQPFAAVAFDALNEAYRAKFGKEICLTDSYRSLQGQYSVARAKPGLSARPGTSQHGLGLAVDMCKSAYTSTAQWNWLKANGPTYGWDNPAWARAGGSGKYEPWHWEYFPLVEY